MTLHLLGLFHTIPRPEFSHCAFTGRVMRFGKMMLPYGYEVVEYSNEGSETQASEHVVILESDRFNDLKTLYEEEQPCQVASTDSTLYREFSARLKEELAKRVKPGDIVCHPFGIAHADLGELFPQAHHVEIGIGYTQCAFPLRVYETYQWWSWHQGKDQQAGNAYQWVCPMGYDIGEWAPSYDPGEYLLYFGRVIECKGLQIVKEIAKRTDLPVRIVGEGDPAWVTQFMADAPSNLTVHPPVTGLARSDLLRGARAMLMPTLYTEPFGGAGVEGMLCGTPLIASDFGAFAETVVHEHTGFRCKTLGDWLKAVKDVDLLDRRFISDYTRCKHSLENVGGQMDKIFSQISTLDGDGWYDETPIDAVWQ